VSLVKIKMREMSEMNIHQGSKKRSSKRRPLLTFKVTVPVVLRKASPVNPLFLKAHYGEFQKLLSIVAN
jgi:hypothetical protein